MYKELLKLYEHELLMLVVKNEGAYQDSTIRSMERLGFLRGYIAFHYDKTDRSFIEQTNLQRIREEFGTIYDSSFPDPMIEDVGFSKGYIQASSDYKKEVL